MDFTPPSNLKELILALADDEFITGFANSEWTGIAPVLEEDIAFSSMAQDELGHARLLYELAAPLIGLAADDLAYGRPVEGYRHARLVERPRGDWAYSVTRQLLYDSADYLRVECLTHSTYAPLTAAMRTIIREEKYHLLHANTWLHRLAEGNAEARHRQQVAFAALWPDALALFEPVEGEAELVAAGVLPEPFATLRQRWLDQLAEPLQKLGLPFPCVQHNGSWQPLVEPANGGRQGIHSVAFAELHATMTSVYRLEPGVQW